MGAPVRLVQDTVPELVAGEAAIRQRLEPDHADHGQVVDDVDRPREAPGPGKEVRMAAGVAHRPEAAHRKARDRTTVARRDRPVVVVDPGDQLVDVEVLPLGRSAGTAV